MPKSSWKRHLLSLTPLKTSHPKLLFAERTRDRQEKMSNHDECLSCFFDSWTIQWTHDTHFVLCLKQPCFAQERVSRGWFSSERNCARMSWLQRRLTMDGHPKTVLDSDWASSSWWLHSDSFFSMLCWSVVPQEREVVVPRKARDLLTLLRPTRMLRESSCCTEDTEVKKISRTSASETKETSETYATIKKWEGRTLHEKPIMSSFVSLAYLVWWETPVKRLVSPNQPYNMPYRHSLEKRS